ncbi:N-acyl homoserine lactonase family protein [Devosia sp.]|uniref:N-acyl homoserine lactonase family protein n=1 Tax=Devosia sp. TaxID=1871048 RepID=UPI002EDF7967
MTQTPDSTTSPMRLYCFDGGRCIWPQGNFTQYIGWDQKMPIPIPFFLIDHPKGKILFETGMHPNLAVDPVGHLGPYIMSKFNPQMTPEQAVVPQLAKIGVEPKDIKYVILSVLFPDHAGGMEFFPDATFIVQLRELQDAWWQDTRVTTTYCYNDYRNTRDFKFWELHDEDLDLFGDGSVEIMFAPAHARGEQALVIRLPETGTVVFPAGVIPQKKTMDLNSMTGTPRLDPVVIHRHMDRLKAVIRRENAKVIYHHCPETWPEVRLAPDYYG